MEFETVTVQLFIHGYIKINHFILHFEWILLSKCNLVTSCVGHLEHFDSLSYTDFPNVDMFHYIVPKKKKNDIHCYYRQSHQKVVKHWEAVKLSVVEFFQNSNFHLKSQTL